MDVLVIDRATSERLLEPRALLAALADGFRALSAGDVVAPARNALVTAAGPLLAMPGHRPGGPLTVKIVTIREENPARGLPSHLATITLHDEDTGACVAVLDGTYVTALRTGAAAALAADLLARRDARTLAIVGAGVQAEQHLHTFPLIRDFAEIRIAARRAADGERLAAGHPRAVAAGDLEEAVRGSDVIALTTDAPRPVIDASWVSPGAHVSSVGYHPPAGELPPELARDGRLFVETRVAFGDPPAGCGELSGLDPARGTELGELLADPARGRRTADEITVWKAMGHVVEDVVAAELVYAEALRTGAGTRVAL